MSSQKNDYETLTIENDELEQFSYDGKRITSVEPDSFVANERIWQEAQIYIYIHRQAWVQTEKMTFVMEKV